MRHRGWQPCSEWRRCPPWWPWRAGSRWPASRVRSRPSTCGAGWTHCWRPPPASSRAVPTPRGGEAAEEEAADPVLEDAREKLDAGDFVAAAAAYQAILDADPNPTNPHHAEATGALRQITFLARATAHPPTAVADADAAPQDIDAAFAAADVQILNQDVAAAFGRLTALVRATAGDDRTRVRTRLIELFDLFDPADPEVITGRRNLANALY